MKTKHNIPMKMMASVLTMQLGFCGLVMADSMEPHSASLGAAVDDTAITTKVKAKFVGENQLKNSDISVTTTNGVVTLTGSAANSDAKSRAEALATVVDGVKSVDNEIQAPSVADHLATKADRAAHKTEDKVSDGWITAKVKSQLLADSGVSSKDIHVKTKNGVVVLSGNLSTAAQREHTVELAQQIKGVKSVDTAALKVATQ